MFIRILGRSGNASLKGGIIAETRGNSHSGRHAAYFSWYQMKKLKDKRGGGTWNISPLTKCIVHFRSIPCGLWEVKVLVLWSNAFKEWRDAWCMSVLKGREERWGSCYLLIDKKMVEDFLWRHIAVEVCLNLEFSQPTVWAWLTSWGHVEDGQVSRLPHLFYGHFSFWSEFLGNRHC